MRLLITPPKGCDLVLTTDAIIAGVHFFAEDAAGDIARKALRVNLSDLAAKGATPLGFLCRWRCPGTSARTGFAGFAQGLRAGCRRIYVVRCSAATPTARPVRSAVSSRHAWQRAGRRHGAPRRREAWRPRLCQRHDRRRRAWPFVAQRRGLEIKRSTAPPFGVALSAAAAAQCTRRRRARARLGGDGCVGWSCRRSRQNVPRLAGLRPPSRWRGCRSPRPPRRCWRAMPA